MHTRFFHRMLTFNTDAILSVREGNRSSGKGCTQRRASEVRAQEKAAHKGFPWIALLHRRFHFRSSGNQEIKNRRHTRWSNGSKSSEEGCTQAFALSTEKTNDYADAHLEFDAMGEKEIQNVLELIVGRTARNKARRQSRCRGSELMSMHLSQCERLA